MPQTALIITEFDLHEGIGVILKIRHSYPTTEELMKVIRRFMKEWGKTEEGQKASQATEGKFDWGDFMEWRRV